MLETKWHFIITQASFNPLQGTDMTAQMGILFDLKNKKGRNGVCVFVFGEGRGVITRME